LFKVFGSHPGFDEYGALLCKSVLQISIAKRFNRSLSAPANNEKIISPVLRLLTEVVRFDEGAHAKAVYAKRDFTLDPKILGRNIGLWRDSTEGDDQRRKPSIRVNAIRYLLANLTYQDELAKIDILSHLNIVRAVFDHLSSDPPFLVAEILDVMMNHVFQDKTIPRYVKSKILTGKTLSHVAGLYKYEGSDSVPEGQKVSKPLFLIFRIGDTCSSARQSNPFSPRCGTMLTAT
jgi:nucleolar pre-ribosomal-associated protein 1